MTVRQVPAFQCSKPGMASAPARLPSWNWRSRMLFVCKLDETLAIFMQNSWIHFSNRHCSFIFVHGWNGTFPLPNPKHDMGGTLTIGMGQNVSVGNPTASICNNQLQSRTD